MIQRFGKLWPEVFTQKQWATYHTSCHNLWTTTSAKNKERYCYWIWYDFIDNECTATLEPYSRNHQSKFLDSNTSEPPLFVTFGRNGGSNASDSWNVEGKGIFPTNFHCHPFVTRKIISSKNERSKSLLKGWRLSWSCSQCQCWLIRMNWTELDQNHTKAWLQTNITCPRTSTGFRFLNNKPLYLARFSKVSNIVKSSSEPPCPDDEICAAYQWVQTT